VHTPTETRCFATLASGYFFFIGFIDLFVFKDVFVWPAIAVYNDA
jgi:hypothetical protein